ncbi:MAG TPA: hypothetical protein VM513_05345, partial [Kofleriaceae bacterium]|nr:hypothetical protein [Kofleriaceae bacterium]
DAVGNGVSAAGYGWAGDTIKGAGDLVDAYNAYYDADAIAARAAAYAAYAEQQMQGQQAWLLQQASAYQATGAGIGAISSQPTSVTRSTCSGICSGVAR